MWILRMTCYDIINDSKWMLTYSTICMWGEKSKKRERKLRQRERKRESFCVWGERKFEEREHEERENVKREKVWGERK